MRGARQHHRIKAVCCLLAALSFAVLLLNYSNRRSGDGESRWVLPGASFAGEQGEHKLTTIERFAWVTSIYDGGDPGYYEMLVLMIRTLRLHGGNEALLVLDDESLGSVTKEKLRGEGCTIISRPPIEVPSWVASTVYRKSNIRNFHRLHLWNLTEYDRLAFIDADMFFVADVDPIRRLPCFSGAAQRYGMVNGGMTVLCPDEEVGAELVHSLWEHTRGRQYREAEQTFLSEFFARRRELKFVSTCYNARAEDYRPWLRAFYRRNSFGRFWPTRDVCAYQDVVLLHFNGPLKPWLPYAKVELAPEIWGLYIDAVVMASGLQAAVPPVVALKNPARKASTNDTVWRKTVALCCEDESCKRICPYYGL